MLEEKEKPENWERDAIIELAQASLKEQRRVRRWNLFFRLVIFIYVGVIIYLMLPATQNTELHPGDHTALVELTGIIANDTEASAEAIKKLLRQAFKAKNSQAVILEINSPGGTPVQAANIYKEILRLREKYPDKKLYAVLSDLCASGGYYVAAAADEIYAGESSMVGSIGVRMSSFGFHELIEKLGIEDRTLTAGENKALLNPFTPRNPEQEAHVKTMLEQVHQHFITDVKAGRNGKLKDDQTLFSGLIWSGSEAVQLGLVDDIGDADYVAREVVEVEKIIKYEREKTLYEELTEGVGYIMAKTVQQFWDEQTVRAQLPR